MGQRHQAFLVARVVPHGENKAKYRCIAAYHHQWCYGTLPLRAARRFLTLVRQKDNAEIIREELRHIDGKYTHGKKSNIPKIPCPFASTLLGLSWSVELTESFPYLSRGSSVKASILPAGMGSWDGDNNDGLTMIDVTDPENPTYCFILNDTPLSGREYCGSYYAIPVPKEGEELEPFNQNIVESVAALEGEPVLKVQVLAEAWPHEYKAKKSADTSNATLDSSLSTESKAGLPTLTDLSLRSAVLNGLNSGDTEHLEEMLWLPGKADIARDILFRQSPFPDTGLPLLTKIVEHQVSTSTSLDLSGVDMSDTQLLQLLPLFSGLASLNLSSAPRISINVVRELLTKLSNLKRLVLMNCPSVRNEDVIELISSQPQLFYRLEAFMHPVFLTFDDTTLWAPSFTALTVHPQIFPNLSGVSLPFFNPTAIVQGLADFLDAVLRNDPLSLSSSDGMAMGAAFTAGARAAGKDWNERSVVAVPRFDHRQVTFDGTTSWVFLFDWDGGFGRPPNGWAFLRFPRTSKSSPQALEKTLEEKLEQLNIEGDKEKPLDEKQAEGAPVDEDDDDEERGGETEEEDLEGHLKMEVHDLRSFVRLAEEEGRPPVPEELLARAEELFQKVAEAYHTPENSGLFTYNHALRRLRAVQDCQANVRSMGGFMGFAIF